MQCQHAGGAHDEIVSPERWPDQREPGQFALRDEFGVLVDEHPRSIKLEPGLDQQCLVDVDAGARLDGIKVQAGEPQVEISHGARFSTERRLAIVHAPARVHPGT